MSFKNNLTEANVGEIIVFKGNLFINGKKQSGIVGWIQSREGKTMTGYTGYIDMVSSFTSAGGGFGGVHTEQNRLYKTKPSNDLKAVTKELEKAKKSISIK